MLEGADAPNRLRALCVFTPSLPPLGADTAIHALILEHLDRSQFDVTVGCVFRRRGRTTPTYERMRSISGIRLIEADLGPELAPERGVRKLRGAVETLRAAATFFRLARLVRRDRIDIIHTTDRPRDAAACVALARITGVPCVIHAHVGYDESWMSGLLTRAIKRADAVIAISKFVADSLVDGGVRADRVLVVLNAIDVGAFGAGGDREIVRRGLGIGDATVCFITVCRLFESKGPGDLIRGLASVRDEIGDFALWIVGHEVQANYSAELRAMADSLGIGSQVTLMGRRDDVAELMTASDVFAMPSLGEPFGLVYLEAMATGRPVIALSDCGAQEIVTHGEHGLLSAPGDLDALAANLRRLALDPVERERMGRAGRDRVERQFDAPRMAADIGAAYRQIAARRRRRQT